MSTPNLPKIITAAEALADAAQQDFHFMPSMSLRDWFAGQALEGILAEFFHHENEAQAAATRAYAMADAMLAERAKGGAS